MAVNHTVTTRLHCCNTLLNLSDLPMRRANWTMACAPSACQAQKWQQPYWRSCHRVIAEDISVARGRVLTRSYVWPVASMQGSPISSMLMGQ